MDQVSEGLAQVGQGGLCVEPGGKKGQAWMPTCLQVWRGLGWMPPCTGEEPRAAGPVPDHCCCLVPLPFVDALLTILLLRAAPTTGYLALASGRNGPVKGQPPRGPWPLLPW